MIPLPPRSNADAITIDDSAHTPIVIIGANGAGKTRFANRLAADLGDRAYRLGVIDALYGVAAPDPEHSAIDRMHAASPAVPAYDKKRPQSRLERLLSMLLSDELVNLLHFKFHGGADSVPSNTRLDALISFWQEVFPGNSVLIDNGNIQFTRVDSADLISAVRLSDGERAVLYYGIALLYAPAGSVVMVDSPEMFLHPATMQGVWNRLERLRPDCTLLYTTHDLEFAASRQSERIIWVRSCDTSAPSWDYELIPRSSALSDQVSLAIMGARKPVLFIEGDFHSIDARLYPLIFPEMTVRSLGSCNKVIEATRTFNDLNSFHHLTARGIVDRDRRDDNEVEYLRSKNIMVPDVAEIENMLLDEDVIGAVAEFTRHKPRHTVNVVREAIMAMFRKELKAQALMHVRHRVKRAMEYRIDAKFTDIGALERHIAELIRNLDARGQYEALCRRFRGYLDKGDYASVLRVYNQKTMLPLSNVAQLNGLKNKDEYIATILRILKVHPASVPAQTIRAAVRRILRAPEHQ